MNEKIMIVDDETAIADLVEVYLQNEGYRPLSYRSQLSYSYHTG